MLWAGDARRKLLVNVTAYGGAVLHTTVTAPGAAELAWDAEHCRALGDHKHSGDLGCRVDADALELWNVTARKRWSALNARAGEATRRAARDLGVEWYGVIASEWELQARGPLHRHLVLPAANAVQRTLSQRYVDALAGRAPMFGFGFVDRGKQGFDRQRRLEPIAPDRAGRYLAKYLAPINGDKLVQSETLRKHRGHLMHVNRQLTRATGTTMRTLRQRRWAWHEAQRFSAAGEADFIAAALRLALDVPDQGQSLAELIWRADTLGLWLD